MMVFSDPASVPHFQPRNQPAENSGDVFLGRLNGQGMRMVNVAADSSLAGAEGRMK